MVVVLVLIVSYFIPTNSKNIGAMNVTYGPNGEFVQEMVPKKQYDELRDEYPKMKSDNINLLQQIRILRAKPLSSYESNVNESEKENSSQVIETTTNESESKFSKNISVVNVTYGRNGKFIQEMVPKKLYDELRYEYQKMESENINLVQQIQTLRARPLSYYENEVNKWENEDSSQVIEPITNIPECNFNATNSSLVIETTTQKYNATNSSLVIEMTTQKYNTTNSSQEVETVTDNPKHKFYGTNSSQIIETTTINPIHEFHATNSSQVVKKKTNNSTLNFNTTNSSRAIKTTTINPIHEFHATNSSQVVKKKTNNSTLNFNTTNSSRAIKTTSTTTVNPKHKFYTKNSTRVTKTTTKNSKHDLNTTKNNESNNTADRGINQQLKEMNKLNRALQKEVNNLTRERNETEAFLYQFKWKILVKHTIDDYEDDFDKLELRNAQPSFQLNYTLINQTIDSCSKFDRLAERRRQRWEFYLNTPPYCNNSFEHLVKRIHASKFTVEEFCRALAILYKAISFTSHLETVLLAKNTAGFLSLYQKENFVIPLLLADYPKTKLIENLFNELKLLSQV